MKLLKNALIITMNSRDEIYKKGDLIVSNDKIVDIGNNLSEKYEKIDEVIDLEGKILMPGLVNTHVHLSQQLGRGVADDVDLLTWLTKRVWPYESSLDEEDSYISSLACNLELIKSGTTTFLEAGGQYVPQMVKAVEKSGMRASLTKSVMDIGEGLPEKWRLGVESEMKIQRELLDKYHNTCDGRVKIWLGLRTIFNNSKELILETKKLADEYNTGIHMHIAEIEEEVKFSKEKNGASTVSFLNNLGVLDKNLLAVHTVWLTKEEIELFKKHDVKVSHNPAAAMKVTLGFAKVPEMLQMGIPVSIGTDGAPSNNRMDMMREIYLTSLIHKGRTLDSKSVPAYEVLKMATIYGAKSALLEKEIGSLEIGKKADLIILKKDTINSLPTYDTIGNIVYSMSSENVESSMCNGKWLMRDRKVLTIDESEIILKLKEHQIKIEEKLNLKLESKYNMI